MSWLPLQKPKDNMIMSFGHLSFLRHVSFKSHLQQTHTEQASTEESARPLSWQFAQSASTHLDEVRHRMRICNSPVQPTQGLGKKTRLLNSCTVTKNTTVYSDNIWNVQHSNTWPDPARQSCPVETKPLVPLGLDISDPVCEAKCLHFRMWTKLEESFYIYIYIYIYCNYMPTKPAKGLLKKEGSHKAGLS